MITLAKQQEEKPSTARFNVYLSDRLWETTRIQAVKEKIDPSALIEYLLTVYIDQPEYIPSSRYRARASHAELEEDPVKARTIRISPEVSEKVMVIIHGKTSFSNLVNYLLRNYLVVQLGEKDIPQVKPLVPENPARRSPASRRVKMGDKIVDLGSDPFEIDLNKKP